MKLLPRPEYIDPSFLLIATDWLSLYWDPMIVEWADILKFAQDGLIIFGIQKLYEFVNHIFQFFMNFKPIRQLSKRPGVLNKF